MARTIARTVTALRTVVLKPGEGRRVTLPDRGAEALFKVTGAETGGRLAVIESASAPDSRGLPPHRHRRSDEALYVLAGEVAIRVGRRTVNAPAGTFVFLPRGTVHAFSNPGPAPARVLVVFAPAGLERFLEETSKLYRTAARRRGTPPAEGGRPARSASPRSAGGTIRRSSGPPARRKGDSAPNAPMGAGFGAICRPE